jgi:hypothetical protein
LPGGARFVAHAIQYDRTKEAADLSALQLSGGAINTVLSDSRPRSMKISEIKELVEAWTLIEAIDPSNVMLEHIYTRTGTILENAYTIILVTSKPLEEKLLLALTETAVECHLIGDAREAPERFATDEASRMAARSLWHFEKSRNWTCVAKLSRNFGD